MFSLIMSFAFGRVFLFLSLAVCACDGGRGWLSWISVCGLHQQSFLPLLSGRDATPVDSPLSVGKAGHALYGLL